MRKGKGQPMTQGIDFKVDQNNLYREEAVTDLKVASIRILTPVTVDGNDDASRPCIYVGHTQLMSPQGPIPIQAKLEATNLKDAIALFPQTMEKATQEVIENIQKLQQEQERKSESRIITPR